MVHPLRPANAKLYRNEQFYSTVVTLQQTLICIKPFLAQILNTKCLLQQLSLNLLLIALFTNETEFGCSVCSLPQSKWLLQPDHICNAHMQVKMCDKLLYHSSRVNNFVFLRQSGKKQAVFLFLVYKNCLCLYFYSLA